MPSPSKAEKLKLLREWVHEFKQRFGCKVPIRCRLIDLSGQIDVKGHRTHPHGMSGLHASGKHAWIALDPVEAWAGHDGPYDVAMHEFFHVVLSAQCFNSTWDEEEVAVRWLTRLYLKNPELV